MSKVQLAGNANGTGIFTIASPNSNTDRTLTLPDNTGTLLSSASTLSPSQLGSQFSINSGAPSNSFAMDASGRVTVPNQTAFFAGKNNANPLTGPATVIFNSVTFNTGSNYNSTTGIFTAPVSGRYFFSANCASQSGVDDLIFQIQVNGVSRTGVGTQTSVQPGQEITGCVSAVFNLSANDQVSVYTERNLRADSTISVNFSGYLIG